MKYLYESRYGTITEINDNHEVNDIFLSPLECKMVEVLCNGITNSWDDITEYMYGFKVDTSKRTNNFRNHYMTRSIKSRLLEKIKLNILNVRGYGLRLLDEIYIR